MYFSIIIPVYNRPHELDELLESLTLQTVKNFEVLVVEDGSSDTCEHIAKKYSAEIPVRYYYKSNSGPGMSRNYGAERATGDYFIVLDSDCIVPPLYMENVQKELKNSRCDAFGGPDKAHDSFSPIQKAINYGMTSFFTTGGIRGGKKKMDKFYPRSFNMGISRAAFADLSGFSNMRFGEDIDFSIRLYKAGYTVCLFHEAWVYHKRRVDFHKFYKQVFNSGIARINLYKKYPNSLKIVHLLPAAFTLGMFALLILSLFFPCFLFVILFYAIIILIDSTLKNKSLNVGLLSVVASFVQLFGYGIGFLHAIWKRIILKKDEFNAFEKNFYK